MNKEVIGGWLMHPVTEKHIKRLIEAKEDIKENWANGAYTAESMEGTAQLNAEAVGAIRQIDQILIDIDNMEVEDDEL
jgi:hypothetical protein